MHKFLRQKSPSDLLIQKTDSAINDSLRFLFAAHAWFVNTPVLTRLRLKQAPVFTGNVHHTTKASHMSYFSERTSIQRGIYDPQWEIFSAIDISTMINSRMFFHSENTNTRNWINPCISNGVFFCLSFYYSFTYSNKTPTKQIWSGTCSIIIWH